MTLQSKILSALRGFALSTALDDSETSRSVCAMYGAYIMLKEIAEDIGLTESEIDDLKDMAFKVPDKQQDIEVTIRDLQRYINREIQEG